MDRLPTQHTDGREAIVASARDGHGSARDRVRSVWLGVVAAIAAVLLFGGIGLAAAGILRPSDSVMEEIVEEAGVRNASYLAEFIRGGGSIRDLPIIEIESYALAPASAEEAMAAAASVVRGTVRKVSFALNASGGLPIATSVIGVTDVAKGGMPASITVMQVGGPVAQPEGGALAQLDNDPLVAAGEEVILLLTEPDAMGIFHTLPGAGVSFIRGNVVEATEANRFAADVDGRSPEAVLAMLRTADQATR